jgi:predicted NBD/HSP70 family sugar kinase
VLTNKDPGPVILDGPRPAARPNDLRRYNLALVLREVVAQGGSSRGEIARATGLTKGTVTVLVQELERLGLLVELGSQADGRVGRPRRALGLNGEHHCGIGLELNVDYTAVCVADLLQRTRFHRVEAVDNRGVSPAEVLDRAARLTATALEAAEAKGLSVAGAGVAVPGMVRVAEGTLLLAPNLGWTDVAVADELAARLNGRELPILVDNEANLAALGELWLGIGSEVGDYVHLSGEIGVGAGVIVDGALFRGSRGFAGEVGHVVVDPGGEPCSCGGRGCLERVAGQEAILRAAGLPLSSGTSLGYGESAVPALVDLLEAGDPDALRAVAVAGGAIGSALADVVNVLDADTIVLGGLYATLAPWLAEPLEDNLAEQVVASTWRPVEVRASKLGPDAAVRGAAAWIVQRVLAAPGVTVAP